MAEGMSGWFSATYEGHCMYSISMAILVARDVQSRVGGYDLLDTVVANAKYSDAFL